MGAVVSTQEESKIGPFQRSKTSDWLTCVARLAPKPDTGSDGATAVT